MEKWQQVQEDIVISCLHNDFTGEEFLSMIEEIKHDIARELDEVEQEEKDQKETERSLLWK